MSEWRKVRVDEIAEKIAIGPFGSRMKSDTYTETGVPVIRGTNLTGGRSFSGDWVYVSEEDADQLINCNVTEGDLVFPHRGAIGEVGIVPGDKDRYMLSTSLMKLRCDAKQADSLYLFYFFKSHEGRHQLLRNASQVGTPGIGQPLSSLKSIELALPPLKNQRAIAHILGTLDDKIELNRRMNETLEAMARAIFKSWFVDFDPVRAKASGEPPESICRRLGLKPDVLALFPDGFQDSELGKTPAGWRIGRLDDLCQLKRGHDLPANARIPGDVPVVSSSGVSGKHTEAKALGPGVITGRYGTIGKVFYIEDDYWPLNTTLYVEDFKESPPRFVFHVLEQVDFSIYTDKAAVPGVNRNHLHMELTSIPPPRVRQSFARTVATLWSQHAAIERQSRVIATLRDALLPRLLSGDLPITQGSH